MKRDPGNEVGDIRHMHGPSCDALSDLREKSIKQ